jgi:hypothetical protein
MMLVVSTVAAVGTVVVVIKARKACSHGKED